jgi:hypothetical protein
MGLTSMTSLLLESPSSRQIPISLTLPEITVPDISLPNPSGVVFTLVQVRDTAATFAGTVMPVRDQALRVKASRVSAPVPVTVVPPALPVSVTPAPVEAIPPGSSAGRDHSHGGRHPDPQPAPIAPRF